MALNNTAADALAQTIVTNLGLTGDQATQAVAHWQQVTRAFFASIVANGQVTVAVTSVSGVTPGGGVSGPGAGTGTIS